MNAAQHANYLLTTGHLNQARLNELIVELKQTGDYDEFVVLATASQKEKAEEKAKQEAETAKIIAERAKNYDPKALRAKARYIALQTEGYGY